MLSGNFGLESSGALSCDHKSKRPACYSWPLAFMYGRSDWIRTSDPLLPKQVRYHAAPRSVMGCFVRKRPCFGKGGPSGGRKGRCLPRAKGPSPAQDKDLRASSTQAGQLRQGAPPFQERKEHPVPLPCARGRSELHNRLTGARNAPSVRTGKKRYCAAKSYGICSPFRAHGEEAPFHPLSLSSRMPLPCARGRSGRSFPMHSAQGRSRGVSVPASRPRPSAWAAGPFQTGNGRKRKTPLESGVHFLMGRKMGLEPTATWATTRCSTN